MGSGLCITLVELLMRYTVQLNRRNSGDLHEAFNLGLDPVIAAELPGVGASAPDARMDNLWPSEARWEGAEAFVGGEQGVGLGCTLME